MTELFTAAWVTILLVFTIVEFTAIALRGDARDAGESPNRYTFSWHVWLARSRWATRAPAFALTTWAFYHFWLESGELIDTGTDDLVLVVVALGVGAVLIRPRRSS